MRAFPLLLLTLAAPVALRAERAILECIADGWAARDGRFHGSAATLEIGERRAALLDFRFSLVSSWRITKATLLLHVAAGKAPDRLTAAMAPARWKEIDERVARVPAGRPVPGTVMEQGWIGVELDVALVQAIVDGKAYGVWIESPKGGVAFHSRESLHAAPYLVVEGERKR